MLYVDYIWDLTPTTIIPDAELNTDRLGWQSGDQWVVMEHEGKKFLKKLEKSRNDDERSS